VACEIFRTIGLATNTPTVSYDCEATTGDVKSRDTLSFQTPVTLVVNMAKDMVEVGLFILKLIVTVIMYTVIILYCILSRTLA